MRSRAVLGVALTLASPIAAQVPSRMTVGVQAPPPPPPRPGAAGAASLSAAEQQRLLEIEQARRGTRRPGTTIDCRPEQAAKAMTDLERASWRLKCGG